MQTKPRYDESQRQAWHSACIKIGQKDAANIMPNGGSINEMHEQRKTLRRAFNALNAEAQKRGTSQEDIAAMEYCGDAIQSLSILIESGNKHSVSAEKTNELRGPESIRAYYSRRAAANSEHGQFEGRQGFM